MATPDFEKVFNRHQNESQDNSTLRSETVVNADKSVIQSGKIVLSDFRSQDVRLMALLSLVIVLILVLAWVFFARRIVKAVRRHIALEQPTDLEENTENRPLPSSEGIEDSVTPTNALPCPPVHRVPEYSNFAEPTVDQGGKGDSPTRITKRVLGKSALTVFTLPKLQEQSDEEASRYEWCPGNESPCEVPESEESKDLEVKLTISNTSPKLTKPDSEILSTTRVRSSEVRVSDSVEITHACGECAIHSAHSSSITFDPKSEDKSDNTDTTNLKNQSEELNEIVSPHEVGSQETTVRSCSSERLPVGFFSRLGSKIRFSRRHSALQFISSIWSTTRGTSRTESAQTLRVPEASLRSCKSAASPKNFFNSEDDVRDCKSTASPSYLRNPEGSVCDCYSVTSPTYFTPDESLFNLASPESFYSTVESERDSSGMSPQKFFSPEGSYLETRTIVSSRNLSLHNDSYGDCSNLASPTYFLTPNQSLCSCSRDNTLHRSSESNIPSEDTFPKSESQKGLGSSRTSSELVSSSGNPEKNTEHPRHPVLTESCNLETHCFYDGRKNSTNQKQSVQETKE